MVDLFSGLRTKLQQWLAAQRNDVHHVRGFRVVVDNSRPDITTAAVIERLDEALALLEQFEPRRTRHLRRDLAQILISRYPCRGAYFPDSRTCLTELTFLARRDISPAVVASSILHEGTHARVAEFRRRVGGFAREQDRAREERLSRRSEIAFGRKLPAELGAPVIERAQASMDLDDEGVAPTIDWTVAQRRIEQADAQGDA
jgi:hypothetical protein